MMLMRRRVVATGLAALLVPLAILGAPSEPARAIDLPSPVATLLPGPVRTIIKEVPVPGPVQTVIKLVPTPTPVPGPTRTIYLGSPSPVPGPTKTVYVDRPVGQSASTRATLSSGTTDTGVPSPSVTVSPSPVPGKTVTKERRVKVTVPQAIGISIGLVLFGIVAGLLALYAVYTLGYKDSKREETNKMRELADDLFGK
jgi:hypothetical protein